MSRTAKAGSLALGLIGLLIVVALAARGGHPSGNGQFVSRAVPATLQDSLVTLLAIAYVVAIVAVIVVFFKRRPLQAPRESHWLRNYLGVLAFMLVATLFGSWAIRHGVFRHTDQKPVPVQGKPRPENGLTELPPGATRPAHFQWPLALGLSVLSSSAACSCTFGSAARLRRVEPNGSRPSLHGPSRRRSKISGASATLAVPSSPHTPTWNAFSPTHGLARTPAEAPLEYLARVLRTLHVRESAVQSLTGLFEYAKFSEHDIDTTMKDDAIAALIAVRDDLQVEERAAA